LLFEPLVLQFAVFSTHQIPAHTSLEVGEDLGQFFLTHLLKLTQNAGLKEYFRVADAILVSHLQCSQDLFRRYFAVHEAGWNRVWRQD